MKWVLRLFPRGEQGFPKNNVAVFLHLLEVEGNALKDVKVNWKLGIINANEIVTNKLGKLIMSSNKNKIVKNVKYLNFGEFFRYYYMKLDFYLINLKI